MNNPNTKKIHQKNEIIIPLTNLSELNTQMKAVLSPILEASRAVFFICRGVIYGVIYLEIF